MIDCPVNIARQQERAAIVAWLRDRIAAERTSARSPSLTAAQRLGASARAWVYRVAADAIERGDHLTPDSRRAEG